MIGEMAIQGTRCRIRAIQLLTTCFTSDDHGESILSHAGVRMFWVGSLETGSFSNGWITYAAG
jgi:hypothetical protein